NLALTLAGIVVIACWLERIRRNNARPLLRVVLFLCAALMLAEQMNGVPWHAIRRDEENEILSRVKPAPAGCKAILVTNTATPERKPSAIQIDAMLAARTLGLPTINGYSGSMPPEWDFYLFDANYRRHAERWAARKGVQHGLCGLDMGSGTWS